MARVLVIALMLFAGASNAATVTVFGDDVKFTYDNASLYGAGIVIGNTIFFTPTTFKAESLNGAGLVQASASLDITVETTSAGFVMNAFQVLENGDYELNGGVGATVSADGGLTVDSQTSAYSDSSLFDAGLLTTQGALTAWSSGTTINLEDTAGWNSDTKVLMTLDNVLSAESLNAGIGEQAFIEKKFEGSAIGITIDMSPVPVPASALLFGSALGLLGWMRRKTA